MKTLAGAGSDASAVPQERWEEAQAWEAEYWKQVRNDGPRFVSSLAEMAECAAWVEAGVAGDPPTSDDWVELGVGPFGVGCMHLLGRAVGRRLVGVDPLALIPLEDLAFPAPVARLVEACREGYEHRMAPGEATGLEDGRFGMAFLHNMLDHVKDPAGVLAESYRLLRPGGWVVVVCDAFSVLGVAKHTYYTSVRFPTSLEVKAHPFRFTPPALLSLVVDAGFTVRETQPSTETSLQSFVGRSSRLMVLAQRPRPAP